VIRFQNLFYTFAVLIAGLLPRAAAFDAGEDDFIDAVLITESNGLSASFIPETFTAEMGEPSILSNAPQRSTWWRWIAPADGVLTLAMVDTDINTPTAVNTLLGVYRGTVVNNLTLVAQNDDYPPGRLSRVTFPVTAGLEYRIKCDFKPGSDNGGMRLSLRFFQPGARTFTGAINNGFGAGRQVFVTLTTTATGLYSGKLTVPGKTFPFAGHAGIDARVLLGVPTAPLSAGISLGIDLANGNGNLPFTLTDGNIVVADQLYRLPTFTKQSPTALAGAYTVRMSMSPADGYLLGKIAPTGRATFAGKAGDGVPVSFGGAIGSIDLTTFALPYLARTLGGKGFLTGRLRLIGGNPNQVSGAGENRYFRPAGTGPFLPTGIQALPTLVGRAFSAPAAGQRALGFLDGTAGAGQLMVNAVAGEIPAFTEALTFSTDNKFSFVSAARRPSLKLNKKTGLITGSIVEPAGRTRKLTGVLTGIPGPTIAGFGTGATSTFTFRVIP
jgi:hypothetical protein